MTLLIVLFDFTFIFKMKIQTKKLYINIYSTSLIIMKCYFIAKKSYSEQLIIFTSKNNTILKT